MTTRTVLAWIAEWDAWDAEATATVFDERRRTGQEHAPHHLPSAEEIHAAILEIQAGWTDRERRCRLVGKWRPQPWRVPRVRSSGISEPDL